MRRSLTRSLPLALLAPAVLPAAAAAQARLDTARAGRPARDTVARLAGVTVVGSATGRGQTRAAAAVDSTRLRAAPPGTSALKIVEQLPGVNVQNADGFGMYEWSNRITIRGFQSAQIGQTMDGVPLGDMSYGNFNGLGVGRAVDPSNLQGAAVAQGTGALGTASGNNLGGVVQYVTADPAIRRGFLVQQMLGQDQARRSTLRFDTGILTPGGRGDRAGSAYLSYSRFDIDKWKSGGERYSTFPGQRSLLFGQNGLFGPTGEQWQDQLNAKGQLFLGAHKLTAFYNYAQRKEADYMDLSLGVFERQLQAPAGLGLDFGPEFDYLGSWGTARRLAELSQQTYTPLTDVSYYWSAQGARQDHLGYLRGEFALPGGVRLEVQPYAHYNRGGGDWHAPSYGAAWAPDPINFRQTQYRGNRVGSTARLTGRFTTGAVAHELEAGGWFEANTSRIRRPRWALVNYLQGPTVDFSRPIRLDFDRTGDIGTTLVYAQNTTRLLADRLRLTYGAKYLRVGADFTNNGNTPTDGIVAPVFADRTRPSLSIPTPGRLLPQAGFVWRATGAEELFGTYAQNMNQFPYSPSGGVFNASPTTFDFFRSRARPELATTVEGGVRTRRGGVEASLTGYTIDYRNRLLGITLCPQTVTCASGFGNVGSVDTRGVEVAFNYALPAGFRLYTSGAYNASTYAANYRTNENDPSTEVQTRGRDVVDAPRLLGSAVLAYQRPRFGGQLAARYVDRRFFTYTNDLVTFDGRTIPGGGYAPAYGLADLSLRYRLGGTAARRGVDLQVNALNLFDRRYISTVGTNGFTAASDNTTLLTGAPRQVFFTIGSTL